MIATLLAMALAAPDLSTGDWAVVAVHRVIAPNQIPGQCFVEAGIEQVVHGRRLKAGDPAAITLACRADDMSPGDGPTVAELRAQKRALVRLDTGGRVAAGAWYALEGGDIPAL